MSESVDKLGRRVDGLKDLMAQKLGSVGKRGDLAARAKRAGRMLPRAARRDAQTIAEAQAMAAHPKLRRRLDPKALRQAEARLRHTLGAIDPQDRRRGYWLGIATGLVFNFMILAAVIVVVLMWRGYL